MEIKEMLQRIIEKGNREDMYKLNDMLDELICDLKEQKPKLYEEYKNDLYELAYGKVITEEVANKWVDEMKPFGKHWTIEQTANAMQNFGYRFDKIEFFIVANMIYNDYNDVVRDNEEMALKMAKDFLDDEDAKENKLYNYKKYIAIS